MTSSAASAAVDLKSLERKRDRRLASPFLRKARWFADFDSARAEACRSGKLIFAHCSISFFDCMPCAQVEGGAFQDPRFMEWSRDVVLFFQLTTQVPSDPHQDLHSRWGGETWPHLVVVDCDGLLLSKVTGPKTVEGFMESWTRAQGLLDLRLRSEAGEPDAAADLLLARLDLGTLTVDEFRSGTAALAGHSAARRAALQGRLADEEVREILRDIRVQGGKRFLAMKADGRVPVSPREAWTYWTMMMEFAHDGRDPGAFRSALEAAQASFADAPQERRMLGEWARKLHRMEILEKTAAPAGTAAEGRGSMTPR